MLFRQDVLHAVRTGAVKLAFRRWRRTTVGVGDPCQRVRQQKDPLERNVRKLENLGLTESLGTGYRLSPRGQALFGAFARDR